VTGCTCRSLGIFILEAVCCRFHLKKNNDVCYTCVIYISTYSSPQLYEVRSRHHFPHITDKMTSARGQDWPGPSHWRRPALEPGLLTPALLVAQLSGTNGNLLRASQQVWPLLQTEQAVWDSDNYYQDAERPTFSSAVFFILFLIRPLAIMSP
jgi:hypothetical protein